MYILHLYCILLCSAWLFKLWQRPLGWARKSWPRWAFPTFRILLWMWKDAGSAPALKGCGWFWFSSTIYVFFFGSESEVSKSGLRYFLCPTEMLHSTQGFLLSSAIWRSLCKNSGCPYTSYCALLSRSNFNLFGKNCGGYTALAWKYLCQGKSRCPLLPVFIIIRSVLCSGIICSIVNTLLCRLSLRW